MVGYSKGFAPLVYRYSGKRPVVLGSQNVWKSSPFDNEQFCQLLGIRTVAGQDPIGFSEVPSALGEVWSSAAKTKWLSYIPIVIKFLSYLDQQYTADFAENRVNLEQFQLTYRGAPGRKEWEWMWNETISRKGGLGGWLQQTMEDVGCDGVAGYRKWRKDQKRKLGTTFRESTISPTTAFDPVWTPASFRFAWLMFGASVVDEDGDIDDDYVLLARSLCYNPYQALLKKTLRAVAGLEMVERGLESAYDEVTERPTTGRICILLNYYQTVAAAHRATGINIAEDKGSWTSKIQDLFIQLGAKVVDGKITNITPTCAKAYVVPWDKLRANVESFLDILRCRMAAEIVADSMPVEGEGESKEGRDSLTASFDFGRDAGVAEYAKQSLSKIKADLGITDETLPGRPTGTPKKPAPEGTWSQWVAVSKMIRKAFTEEIGKEGDPTLVADQVGMGKTATTILFIQVLWMLKGLQDANPSWPEIEGGNCEAKWPKILGKRRFYMGLARIPALPIVIVMQKGMTDQWTREINDWIAPGQVHVMEYFGNDATRASFFAPSSLFNKAMEVHPERIIVLAQSKPLTAEMRSRMLNQCPSIPRGDPCTTTPSLLEGSIFAQSWLLGVLEEAHQFRTNGPAQRCMTTLMDKCVYRAALTATPLHTKAPDLLSLGRMLRAREFIGDAGEALTKTINKLIRDGEKAWDADPEHPDFHTFLREHRIEMATAPAEDSSSATSRASSPKIEEFVLTRTEDTKSFRSFWSSLGALKLLRTAHESLLIRRDERSVDWEGKRLIKYAKEIRIPSWISLDQRTEREMEVMTQTEERRLAGRQNLDGFFTTMKQILVHYMLRLYKEEDKYLTMSPEAFAEHLFPTLEAYHELETPKLNRLLRIVKHHTGESNTLAPPLEWSRVGKEIPTTMHPRSDVGQNRFRRRKVVVYCHIRASWSLVAQALKINGIESCSINGTQEADERAEAISRFQSEDGPDVILISDVAAAGLNLQRGSIVIFVDHPWSASEVRQIIGRVLRLGQDRQVFVYELMVPGTCDEFLQGFADGKALMSSVYNRELTIRGHNEIKSDVESESESQEGRLTPLPPLVKSKSLSKPSRQKPRLSSKAPPDAFNNNAPSKKGPDLSEKALSTSPDAIKFHQSHPSVPSLGPKPRKGTKAHTSWTERVNSELAALRQSPGNANDVPGLQRSETNQPMPLSRVKPKMRPPPPQESSDPSGKGKGKGKAAPFETPTNIASSATADTDLTQTHWLLLQHIGNGVLTLNEALDQLERQNLPLFPPDVLAGLAMGRYAQSSGSGSTLQESVPSHGETTAPLNPTAEEALQHSQPSQEAPAPSQPPTTQSPMPHSTPCSPPALQRPPISSNPPPFERPSGLPSPSRRLVAGNDMDVDQGENEPLSQGMEMMGLTGDSEGGISYPLTQTGTKRPHSAVSPFGASSPLTSPRTPRQETSARDEGEDDHEDADVSMSMYCASRAHKLSKQSDRLKKRGKR